MALASTEKEYIFAKALEFCSENFGVLGIKQLDVFHKGCVAVIANHLFMEISDKEKNPVYLIDLLPPTKPISSEGVSDEDVTAQEP